MCRVCRVCRRAVDLDMDLERVSHSELGIRVLKIGKVELPVSENSTESTKRGGIGAQNGHKTEAGCRIFCSENAVFQ